MKHRSSLTGAGIAVALTLAITSVARADESTEKQQLEQRVQDLERELTEVKSSLRGGYFTANSDLEARVAELERTSADNSMSAMFKNGLKSQSGDGAFKYQFFGLIQNDYNWYWDDGDNYGSTLNPESGFRRIRLGANGQMYGNVKWWSELNFSGGDVSVADMWMELTGCSFGSIRVGHMKEPYGFDWQTSDKFTQFMERNYIYDMGPGRGLGIMLHGNCADDMVLYQVGAFRDSASSGDDVANAKDGEYNFTARVSGRPIVEDDGTTWLHLGLSGSYRDFPGDGITPDTYTGTGFHGASTLAGGAAGAVAGSAGIETDRGLLSGFEAAYVAGPITLLGEYGYASLRSAENLDSLSVEAAYWLTGENTAYDKASGSFGRTAPKHNFGDGEGMGAWQLGLRFERIDQDHDSIDTWTLGVNWWLNPNTRVSFNAMNVRPDAGVFNDDFTTLALRFQLDF